MWTLCTQYELAVSYAYNTEGRTDRQIAAAAYRHHLPLKEENKTLNTKISVYLTDKFSQL